MMNSKMLLMQIPEGLPSVEINHGQYTSHRKAMSSLGYESTDHSNVPFYKVIPVKVA